MSVGTVAHRFATPTAARTKARRNPAGFLRSGRWVLALAVLPLLALANDRPYQETRTAIAEDDDNSWSVESWVARRGGQRSLSVEPEYSFDPRHSVQMEFSRSLDRDGAGTGHAVEVEYKYLFNRFDRDGYGAGLSLALGADRLRGDDGRSTKSLGLKLPLSWALGDAGIRLHFSPGWHKASDAPASGVLALAADAPIGRRGVLFAEYAAQRGEQFAQAGIRWWLTKERLAVDLAATRHREDGIRRSGLILGIGWYDL